MKVILTRQTSMLRFPHAMESYDIDINDNAFSCHYACYYFSYVTWLESDVCPTVYSKNSFMYMYIKLLSHFYNG